MPSVIEYQNKNENNKLLHKNNDKKLINCYQKNINRNHNKNNIVEKTSFSNMKNLNQYPGETHKYFGPLNISEISNSFFTLGDINKYNNFNFYGNHSNFIINNLDRSEEKKKKIKEKI